MHTSEEQGEGLTVSVARMSASYREMSWLSLMPVGRLDSDPTFNPLMICDRADSHTSLRE